MKQALSFFFLSIFLLNAYPQTYKQVKIYFDHPSALIPLNLAIDHAEITDDNALIAFLGENEFRNLQASNLKYEILIDDWHAYYDSRPLLTSTEKSSLIKTSAERFGVSSFDFGSMGGYYTLQEVYNKLDSMYINYPSLVTQRFQIGTSVEGRAIYAVKISDNPNTDENEPEVFYNALTHAREPQGMMSLIYFMFYLLENYRITDEATYLVNNRELYFVPVVNPDGYEFNRALSPQGGGMWRKNKRLNSNGSFGVDLNRNYGFMWGYDGQGSSSNPSSEVYRGTTPFSEPEIEAIRNFCLERKFKAALNYHTYSNLLIYPWSYVNQRTPDSLIFNLYAEEMTMYNRYKHGTAGELLYPVNGDADDWMYGEQAAKEKIIAMTPEVGTGADGFWPMQNRIFPLAQENLYPNLYLAWRAGEYVKLTDYSLNKEIFLAGDAGRIYPFLFNYGLSDGHDITVQLESVNSNVTLLKESVTIDTIAAWSSKSVSAPLEFYISSSVLSGDIVKLVVTVVQQNFELSKDTISFRVDAVIPVELISLKAEQSGNKIHIAWETGNEINNAWFQIERKKLIKNNFPPGDIFPPENDWVIIGFIPADDQRSGKTNYQFVDRPGESGRYYYRIKQIDLDGTFKIFNPVEVNFKYEAEYSLQQNYPNPFSARSPTDNPTTRISFSIPAVETGFIPSLQLKVYDILGREVRVLVNEVKQPGVYEIEFNAGGLSSGVYLYKLTAGSYTESKKMIIMK